MYSYCSSSCIIISLVIDNCFHIIAYLPYIIYRRRFVLLRPDISLQIMFNILTTLLMHPRAHRHAIIDSNHHARLYTVLTARSIIDSRSEMIMNLHGNRAILFTDTLCPSSVFTIDRSRPACRRHNNEVLNFNEEQRTLTLI